MTKARARERAKAKAAQKVKKREAKAEPTAQRVRPEQFGLESGSIKGPVVNSSIKKFAGAKRGAARSR
jgi:hypothetical protein